MRPAVIFVALLILFHVCSAQTKYEPLIQRIALLKTYLDYLKKGYYGVQEGLRTVQELKKGELNLHEGYFNGLREIDPSIKQYSTVLETIRLYIQIMDESRKLRNMLNGCKQLSQDEVSWISKTCSHVMDDSKITLDMTVNMITDGQFELTDDERLQQIGLLHDELSSKATFVRLFRKDVSTLMLVRIQEKNTNDKIKEFYQIK